MEVDSDNDNSHWEKYNILPIMIHCNAPGAEAKKTFKKLNFKDFENEDPSKNDGLIDPCSYYENYNIQLGNLNDYEVQSKIGRGRYSEVFQGYNHKTNTKVVIKILKAGK